MLPISVLRSLYIVLGPGALSGHLFADLCDQLLLSEAREKGFNFSSPSDRAGDFKGLDAYSDGGSNSDGVSNFDGFEGKVGFQYKFVASESHHLGKTARRDIKSSLQTAMRDNRELAAWILVTPEDFNKHQMEWLTQMVADIQCPFPVKHWGQKKLSNLILTHPQCAWHYYPELAHPGTNVDLRQWCLAQITHTERLLSQKYTDIKLTVEDNEHVESSLLRFIRSSDKTLYCLLGGFGAGKTTALENLTTKLCREFMTNATAKLPVLIRLRHVRGDGPFHHNLLRYLASEYGITLTFEQLHKLAGEGNLVLLFDGLDEKEDKVNRQISHVKMREVFSLIAPKGKMVVSSRTEFFADMVEEWQLLRPKAFAVFGHVISSHDPKSEIHYLQLLHWGQIQQHLKNRFGGRYRTMLGRIQQIYDLSDLVVRPVLLDMICKVLPQVGSAQDMVHAASLYEMFAIQQVEENVLSSRSFSPVQEKMRAIELLAVMMVVEDRFRVHASELEVSISTLLHEEIIDFRNTSFLVRDKYGNFEFSHRSFVEYFAARAAFGYLREHDPDLRKIWDRRHRWSSQQIRFLDEIIESELSKYSVSDSDASLSTLKSGSGLEPVTSLMFRNFVESFNYAPVNPVDDHAGYAAVCWFDAVAYLISYRSGLLTAKNLITLIDQQWPDADTELIPQDSFYSAFSRTGVIRSKEGLVLVRGQREWCKGHTTSRGRWFLADTRRVPETTSLGPRSSAIEPALFRCVNLRLC